MQRFPYRGVREIVRNGRCRAGRNRIPGCKKLLKWLKKTLENAQKIFILVIFVALGQSYEETSATVIHANSGRSLGAALRFIGAGAGQGHRQTDRSGCR